MPGRVLARLVALDGLVHGWDLATSTSQEWTPTGTSPMQLLAAFTGRAACTTRSAPPRHGRVSTTSDQTAPKLRVDRDTPAPTERVYVV